ncbi:MAG: hypothetical protein MJ126_04710 [Lachnospiraceae bacterium]|nr:hypothetical protein [Lachnospiraceae bacterium]
MIIDTEKITKDYERFCEGQHDCDACPVSVATNQKCSSVRNINVVYPIIQKWIAEHPVKTYLTDMKDKFPDMIIDNDFTMKYCVWRFYGKNAKPKDGCVMGGCKKCWNREIE